MSAPSLVEGCNNAVEEALRALPPHADPTPHGGLPAGGHGVHTSQLVCDPRFAPDNFLAGQNLPRKSTVLVLYQTLACGRMPSQHRAREPLIAPLYGDAPSQAAFLRGVCYGCPILDAGLHGAALLDDRVPFEVKLAAILPHLLNIP